jgi:hypothetical protein
MMALVLASVELRGQRLSLTPNAPARAQRDPALLEPVLEGCHGRRSP